MMVYNVINGGYVGEAVLSASNTFAAFASRKPGRREIGPGCRVSSAASFFRAVAIPSEDGQFSMVKPRKAGGKAAGMSSYARY
jgi:hypothetical protein